MAILDPKRLPLALWEGPEHESVDRQRVTATWQAELDRDPQLRHAYTVVELILGDGTRWRVAEKMLDSLTLSGEPRALVTALVAEPDVVNNYDIGVASATARTMPVVVPAHLVDIRARLASGLPIAGFGEVSLLTDYMPWNRRRVILRGDMMNVSFGSVHEGGLARDLVRARYETELLQCTLQDPRSSADAPWPAPLIDDTRWSSPHEGAIGQAYPAVYGTFVVPARRVSSVDFVVATGHTAQVTAVWRNDALVTGNFAVSYDHDEQGFPVTLITDTFGYAWEDSDRVYAEVVEETTSNHLVDVLRRAVVSIPGGSLLLNEQLMADAEAKLPGTAIVGTASNKATTLIQWVESGLLDDWPMVSMVWDGGRWGPVVTDWRSRTTFDLTAGTADLGDRLTDWSETDKLEIYNDFEVRWGFNSRLKTWAGVLIRNPDNDATCAASEAAVGPRRYPAVELTSVPTEEAAGYVADWLVSHLAIPSLYAEFPAPAGAFLRLRRGDTGYLSDPESQIVSARATIERIAYRRGQCVLGIRLWQSRYRGVASV